MSSLNYKDLKDKVVGWIQRYFSKNGKWCSAVIGVSGGKDSSVVASLCSEALGKERVFGVLMPNGTQDDIDDSYRLVSELDIQHTTINIEEAFDVMVRLVDRALPCGISNQAKINLPPRIRMAILYAVAQSLKDGGRVANTCNASEDYVGYSTKFGDGAGDFSPLANLTVEDVIGVGLTLPISEILVTKTPADGLCGKTDEDNLGFTYAQLDRYIKNGTCGDKSVDAVIAQKHLDNMHKLLPMPSFVPGGEE